MNGPMEGVRVLDLSIALTGPYAAALLADQGAEVIKVERPGGGDIARWIGVSVNGMSSLFLVCNRGKRSIAVDLQRPEGVDDREGARGWGVTWSCRTSDPVSWTGWASATTTSRPSIRTSSTRRCPGSAPRVRIATAPAYDTVIQAYGGLASSQADPADGVPVFLRQAAADKVTALFASQAITAALFARARGRGGQHVQVSMMDAVVSFLWADSAANEVLLASDNSMPSSFVAGSQPFRFSDAWGIVTPTSDHDFAGMCRALGVEGYDDPRVATIVERFKHREATAQVMESCYANATRMTSAAASERFEAEGVPYAMILSPDELTRDPHALAVGLFEYQSHHVVGQVRLPRHPAQFSSTPASLAGGSPMLGEHTDEILAGLGLSDRIAALRSAGVVQ